MRSPWGSLPVRLAPWRGTGGELMKDGYNVPLEGPMNPSPPSLHRVVVSGLEPLHYLQANALKMLPLSRPIYIFFCLYNHFSNSFPFFLFLLLSIFIFPLSPLSTNSNTYNRIIFPNKNLKLNFCLIWKIILISSI